MIIAWNDDNHRQFVHFMEEFANLTDNGRRLMRNPQNDCIYVGHPLPEIKKDLAQVVSDLHVMQELYFQMMSLLSRCYVYGTIDDTLNNDLKEFFEVTNKSFEASPGGVQW